MQESFLTYLNDIKVSQTMINRIENLYKETKSVFGIDIEAIFVSNMDNSNNKELVSLWFFNTKAAIECKNFADKDDFDLTKTEELHYIHIRKTNYALGNEPNDSSKIDISAQVGDVLSINIMATGNNCKYAMEIAKKYLIPTL